MVFVKRRSGNAAPILYTPGQMVRGNDCNPLHGTPSVPAPVRNPEKIIYRGSRDLGEKLFLTRVHYPYILYTSIGVRLMVVTPSFGRKTLVECGA